MKNETRRYQDKRSSAPSGVGAANVETTNKKPKARRELKLLRTTIFANEDRKGRGSE